jgi:hypothetical protein
MKSYGSSFPPGLRVGGRNSPERLNPGSAPNIDRGEADLERGEATAGMAAASIRTTG